MNSENVGIEEARKRLGDYVTAAQQGAIITITRNGKPAATITAYEETAVNATIAIIDKLNAYEAGEGTNIWQDIILDLDEYDAAATEELDPSGASDRFALADGTIIRWDGSSDEWYEQA
jgi:prevent-host-death family protein